jgi:hypothetical protein
MGLVDIFTKRASAAAFILAVNSCSEGRTARSIVNTS